MDPSKWPQNPKDVASKAFSQIKVIAKKFQVVYPKMEYAEAMAKTVNGFEEIHKSKVIKPTSSAEEWEKVYSEFMSKHGLTDIEAGVAKGTSQVNQMEAASNAELKTFI